jgi:hypothetical protein
MKILSKYKDYYDYLSTIYGVDPKIVYERKRIDKEKIYVGIRTNLYLFPLLSNMMLRMKIIVINGVAYPFIQQLGSGYESIEYPWEPFSVKHKIAYLSYSRQWFKEPKMAFKQYMEGLNSPVTKNLLIKISRFLGHPVFIIKGEDNLWCNGKLVEGMKNFCVDSELPILKDWGFPAILPPEKIYQELCYFIGNMLHENPDITPPATVGDKNRYIQKGFDWVKSFRGKNK